ncbi:histidine kinase [Tamilnaduibacter salinus]|uniref:histidine kinase n=1 Tax=Tamilnaduibacter salinus TaxID=1484056 RepID=A0A2A2I6L9_9GAMM|nr:XrtA/PEP-CTERM system histidine kinase PrsK [Tamilnaduibacter salinus]PAV27028.1 histidine kinase [Tamilnaduibacter salinus]
MVLSFSLVSHAAATLAFALLAILIVSKYLRRSTDRALLVATLASVIWAGSLVTQDLFGQPPFHVRYLLELVRDGGWLLVLYSLLNDPKRSVPLTERLRKLLTGAGALLLGLLFGAAFLELLLDLPALGGKSKIMGQVGLALLGLCLVEQIWRNASQYGRSSVQYLCIGAGSLFVYDFFMYSDALLFGQMSDSFWNARGAANALFAPLFAINMVNTRRQPVNFQLSRNAVFHVGTLTFAGIYLIFAAAAGYYVRALGGQWGEALQVLLLTAFLVLFATLLTSVRFRARIMMFISQNFFDYKYDYREEWLKMTQIFADFSDDPPLPERVVRIMADLVESNAGALWVKDNEGNYVLQSSVNLPAPRFTDIDGKSELIRFFNEREWIIDLHEYRDNPLRYDLLEIPDPILKFGEGWLIIPLYLGEDLYGLCLIGNPYARVELNWENFDLIRVVARQTCNVLAQADAQNRLSRAMQFEAVNKASAFMVHDLKTMIAQLSLLVKNAPRHRDNPEFIDDMIQTTDHAVRKLSSLVDHIRKPAQEQTQREIIELSELVQELANDKGDRPPVPIVDGGPSPVWVEADRRQLRNVLGHLIRNAQEATPPDGDISLTIKQSSDHAVLFIQDTGSGMSEEFIRMRLFKPFESTKGLAGMGIGAYQAREYLNEIGGSIDVTSEPGTGSCFSIRFPLASAPRKTAAATDEEPQRAAGE